MTDTKQLTLPITGMTCANCVATVERNLKKLDGVSTAVVNLSSERATVEFDPHKLALPEIIARVERAGYGVASGEADLLIKRLADDNDARRLEKALAKLEGVLEASVSLATERARVRYIPTLVSQAEIRQAVAKAGFEAVETGRRGRGCRSAGAPARDRRAAPPADHRPDLHRPALPALDGQGPGPAAGLLLHQPLSMGGMPEAQPWFNWLHAGAGHPGAVLRRLAVLRRRL